MEPIKPLSDEILLSLCDQVDFSKTLGTYQAVQDYVSESLKFKSRHYLSRILDRTQLNDRYPIFGRDGDLFTRNLVGWNYDKKKVTIPTFDITAAPVVPASWFCYKEIDKLRRIIDESIVAIIQTQTEYLYQLMQACGEYNKFYPLVSIREEKLTKNLLNMAIAPMEKMGITPTALFINIKDMNDDVSQVLSEFKPFLTLFTSLRGTDRAYYIFGRSKNSEFSTGHIVDNLTKFRINPTGGPNSWQTSGFPVGTVPIVMTQSNGFLIGKPAVLKIDRVIKPEPEKVESNHSRVQAYVVGEEDPGNITSIIQD